MAEKKTPTASELAAQRLGYGLDPLDEALADLEDLLSREKWSEDDPRRARDVLARIRELTENRDDEDEAEELETRKPTASELAGQHLRGVPKS